MKSVIDLILGKSDFNLNRHASLDGIRGMAFLLVLISHIFGNQYKMGFHSYGKIGVWLFFVLSSFLLSSYFISKPERVLDPLEWLNYIARRFLRIFPLFSFVLILYMFGNFLIDGKKSAIDHLTLQLGNGHFWTIPVEVKYYLILPLVVISLIYVFKLNWIASIVGLFVITYLHQRIIPAETTQIASINLMTYLPVFVSGSVAALIHNKLSIIEIPKRIRSILDALSFLMLTVLILSVPAIFSVLIYPIPFGFYDKKFIYYGLLFSSFILCVLHGRGYSRKLFESKLLRFIGVISFSAYLIHPIILFNIRRYIPDVTLIGVVIMVVTIFISATILHLIFERPFMKISLLQAKKKINVAQQETT